MKMKLFVFSLIMLLLLTGLEAGCSRTPPLTAPELDFGSELEALEPITPDLRDIDVGNVELPLDLLGTIEVVTDVSPPVSSFDLSLPPTE